MQKVYLDSNVFIAFIKSDMGKPFKLMFQDVEEFLAACPERYLLVLSDHACHEIRKAAYYSEQETIQVLRNLEILTEFVKTTSQDAELAKFFAGKGIHSADALHVALAIKADCRILLTFNKKDLTQAQEFITVREPKELID